MDAYSMGQFPVRVGGPGGSVSGATGVASIPTAPSLVVPNRPVLNYTGIPRTEAVPGTVTPNLPSYTAQGPAGIVIDLTPNSPGAGWGNPGAGVSHEIRPLTHAVTAKDAVARILSELHS